MEKDSVDVEAALNRSINRTELRIKAMEVQAQIARLQSQALSSRSEPEDRLIAALKRELVTIEAKLHAEEQGSKA